MEIVDGPIPPDQFAFGGVLYQIQIRPLWRLIDHVWRQPNFHASVDSLKQAVWNDATHDISYWAVATLRRDANRFFRSHKLPFEMRARQESVLLLRQDPAAGSDGVTTQHH